MRGGLVQNVFSSPSRLQRPRSSPHRSASRRQAKNALLYAVHRISRSLDRSGSAAVSSSSKSRPKTAPPTSPSGNRATSEDQAPPRDPRRGSLFSLTWRFFVSDRFASPVEKPSRRISDYPMPARAGSKEAAVPPILPRGMSALARAGLDSRATKSAPPRPAARRLRRP